MRLSEILDGLLTFAAGSFMGIVILGYFTHGWTVIVGGLAVGVCLAGLVGLIRSRKAQSGIGRKRIEAAMEALVFMGPELARDYVAGALNKRYSVTDRGDHLLCGRSAVFCFFRPRPLTVCELAEFYGKARTLPQKAVVLCAYGADSAAQAAAARYQVTLFGPDKICGLLQLTGCVPEPAAEVRRKRRLFAAFAGALEKRKAKKYFIASLLLFSGALILPMGIYYTAVACLSLALGIACLIPKKAK